MNAQDLLYPAGEDGLPVFFLPSPQGTRPKEEIAEEVVKRVLEEEIRQKNRT